MSGSQGRWRRRLRIILGLAREHRVGRVRYRERTREPLSRALSARGSGAKAYDVRFADGSTMVIHCTRRRVYEDLAGARADRWSGVLGEMARPGMRVCVFPGGTGAAAELIAGLVGPSGAVVSIDPDTESVQFATRRYPEPVIAHECGALEALGGETDGAFDGALIALETPPDDDGALEEVIRIIRPGGWILIRLDNRTPEADVRRLLEATEGEHAPPHLCRIASIMACEPTAPGLLLVLAAPDGPGGAR